MTTKMSEAAKAARREYMKEYRQRPGNKERQKEYNRKYWERKAKEAEGGESA